jgi:hypothetical protein
MAGVAKKLDSLRLNRFETERIILVLAISLTLHLVAFGGYEFGRKLHLLPWLRSFQKQAQVAPRIQNSEEPLEFVTVEQPTVEPPQNAKYYSSQNSKAANPDAEKELNQPKLDGKQTEVAKAETAPRRDFNKLQPQPPKPEQLDSHPTLQPGDLILGKPEKTRPEEPRPRTIKQALAQNHSPGVQMQQTGGVPNRQLVPSFDVKTTPFGAYDAALVEAVSRRWYDLLDSQQFAQDRKGKVTLRFHLNYDGTITEMQVLDNSVGQLLGYVCQKAISDPAPFAAWPSDMRRMVAENYREITFTFYYY